MSQLKHFASLWTLMQYPNGNAADEWSFEQKFAAIRAAGFDGYQWYPDQKIAEAGKAHDLEYLGLCLANSEDYVAKFEALATLKPLRVNVQLGDHLMPPELAARTWIQMLKLAADLGFEIDLETHRGRSTETPEKTWRIAEIVAQETGRPIRLNFDFSHFAVVKHLVPPYAPYLLNRPDLLHESRQIHLRPFNGHHCEIPITNAAGELTDWAGHWFDFAAEALATWRKGNSTETLWACPEFGSLASGYWIAPFSDPWKDTQVCRDRLAEIWKEQEMK